MAWTTPREWLPGRIVTRTHLQEVSDDLQWLYDNRFDATRFGWASTHVTPSADLTADGFVRDIPGGSAWLDKPGSWLLVGVIAVNCGAPVLDTTARMVAWCNVAGINLTHQVYLDYPIHPLLPVCEWRLSQVWLYTNGAGTVLAKLTVQNQSNDTPMMIYRGHTRLTAQYLGTA